VKHIALTLLGLIALPLLAIAKGETTRITLLQSGQPIATMGAAPTREFRFGPGPGNSAWNARSWIVQDWMHPVAEPPRQIPRLQVSFEMVMNDSTHRDYVVHYAFDRVAGQGYVYLPGRGEQFFKSNVNLMLRGDAFEGHWFRATPEWTLQAQAAIKAAGN